MINPYLILAAIIFYLSSLGLAFHSGVKVERNRQAAIQLKAEQRERASVMERYRHIEAIDREWRGKINSLEAELLRKEEEIRQANERLKREIPKYVTPQADARCPIPSGFVELWNRPGVGIQAGSSAIPGPASSDVDEPSGVALSTVAEVNADNHAAYDQAVASLEACRKWGVEVKQWYEQVKGIQ